MNKLHLHVVVNVTLHLSAEIDEDVISEWNSDMWPLAAEISNTIPLT